MGFQIVRCARYARISFDKAGDEHGVANQLADQQRVADTRGFVIVRTEVDNDISALNSKHRPGYEAVMAAAARREIDVVLVFQTSRFWRNRRERAEGIEILRKAGVSLIATKGPSLDMSTAYGRGMAGLLGEFDTMESPSSRPSVSSSPHSHGAANGKPPAGVRLAGYKMTSGEPIEDEAEVVERMFARFHAGDSLRGLVAWLTGEGVPTRSGRPWNPSSVRTILTNPRYAGRAVYQGKPPNGQAGAWPPLVEEWLFDAVQAKLSDPRRRKQVGTDPEHHCGSGLYLCGICGNPVRPPLHQRPPTGGVSQLRYRCPEGGHVTRSAAPLLTRSCCAWPVPGWAWRSPPRGHPRQAGQASRPATRQLRSFGSAAGSSRPARTTTMT